MDIDISGLIKSCQSELENKQNYLLKIAQEGRVLVNSGDGTSSQQVNSKEVISQVLKELKKGISLILLKVKFI